MWRRAQFMYSHSAVSLSLIIKNVPIKNCRSVTDPLMALSTIFRRLACSGVLLIVADSLHHSLRSLTCCEEVVTQLMQRMLRELKLLNKVCGEARIVYAFYVNA